MGSTCAVNSLIQIICREPILRNIILETNINDDTLAGNLREILHLMYNENKSLIPAKFIKKLYDSLKNNFNIGEQIDIGELWIFLLDNLITEINNIPRLTKVLNNIEGQLQTLEEKYEDAYNKFNSNKTSKLLECCQGFYLNIISCNNCDNILHNFEPFTTIMLDIPENQDTPSITSMLRIYMDEECINNEWKCDKCNTQAGYKKTTKIWKIPDVLVFIIKRFKPDGRKDLTQININKSIIFKSSAILSNLKNDSKYTLSSVGLHFSSSGDGGHYCAMCNIDDDNTTRCNYDNFVFYDDINITKINSDTFENFIKKNKDAYMVVYSI